MPSLNLRNPLRRDPNRPTLKQRAATLKASAARLIRKAKPLPAAGSPEALEAFGAACRAVDCVILRRDERDALSVIPGRSRAWTSEAVYAAQAGNFSTFTGEEAAVARATPRARLEELLVLTLRRELSLAEAVRASRIRELHALVYGDEPDPADEDEAPAAFVPADDAELIALGHAFDAATIRHRQACDALDAAEDRAMSRIPERPEFAGEAADRGTVLNLTEAANEIADEAERSRALARIGELSAALDAWGAARDQALGEENEAEERAAADEASDEAAAIAQQATALPARTLAGVWVKVRIAAFYGVADPTASPAEGYTGEAVLRSLYRDAPRLVLDAETADIRIVLEA